jgi:hypothetical protein
VKLGLISSSLGRVGISGSAADNVRVTRTQLLIDGKAVASSSSGTLSYTWNTRKVSRGSHSLVIKAWDAVGNVGQASTTYLR